LITTSRLAKALALVLIAFAVWRSRPPDSPTRVLVLVLPGATASAIESEGALVGGVIGIDESIRTGASFWRRLLSLGEAPDGDPEAMLSLWEGVGGAIRVVDPPSRIFPKDERTLASAFVGDSGGALVDAGELTAGRLPPPYDRAIEAVTATAATLGRDQWSEWISTTPASGSGGEPAPLVEFQFARVGDGHYYFSPAYVVGANEFSGEPFLLGAEAELRPLLAVHALEVSRRRREELVRRLRSGEDARPAVVFEELGQRIAGVFAPETVPASMVAVRDAALAATLRDLRGVVGQGGLVLVVGGPTASRASSPAWYRICSGGDSGAAESVEDLPLDLRSARALLLHLVAVAPDPAEQVRVPEALASRFPVPARFAVSAPPGRELPVLTAWSAAKLESLPGAVAAGN
jgi:hypothetical protein